MTLFAVVVLIALAWDAASARIEPWRPCKCGNRGCVRCHWIGKRPKLLARVVRRAKLREEGWYG